MQTGSEVDMVLSDDNLLPDQVDGKPKMSHAKKKASEQSIIGQINFADSINLDSEIPPETVIQIVYIAITCLLAFELFFLAIQLQAYVVYAVAVFEFLITIAYSNNAVKTVFFHFSLQIIGVFFPIMLISLDVFHISDPDNVVSFLQYYEFNDLSNYIKKRMSLFYSMVLFISQCSQRNLTEFRRMWNFNYTTENGTLVFGRLPVKLVIEFYQFIVLAFLFINVVNSGNWVVGLMALIQLVLLFGFVYGIKQIMTLQLFAGIILCIYSSFLFGESICSYFAENEKTFPIAYLFFTLLSTLVHVVIVLFSILAIDDVKNTNNLCPSDTDCFI